jgi:hypothetical protein
MPLFRVTGTDVHRQQPRVFFVEADTPDAAAAHMASRGITQPLAQPADAPDPNAVIYRVPAANLADAPNAYASLPPTLRRFAIILAALLLLSFMAWFITRAREHLTRTDLRPNLPVQSSTPRSATN